MLCRMRYKGYNTCYAEAGLSLTCSLFLPIMLLAVNFARESITILIEQEMTILSFT